MTTVLLNIAEKATKPGSDEHTRELIKVARAAFEQGRLKARDGCCGKCAFKQNSPERCDEWGWFDMVKQWAESKGIFLCHEGIPGHAQRVDGAELRVCAGWARMNGKPLEKWLALAYTDGRRPDPAFHTGYEPDEWCIWCPHHDTDGETDTCAKGHVFDGIKEVPDSIGDAVYGRWGPFKIYCPDYCVNNSGLNCDEKNEHGDL